MKLLTWEGAAQGSRLTAYELVYEKIPGTLICDSMAAYKMSLGEVDAIVVRTNLSPNPNPVGYRVVGQ